MQGKEELLTALIDAFLMEKETKLFYVKVSEQSKSTEVQKAFQALSGWENDHMMYIQNLYQSVMEDRDVQGFEEFTQHASAPTTEAGIPAKVLEQKVREIDFTDESSALSIALEIEVKAYKLYRGLSESAQDRNAKIFFTEMVEQEKNHIDYLNSLRSKLA